MSRVYNFSAGPAVLPEEVLRKAANELVDFRGTGMSVMEMSHRSKAYDAIHREAEADLRTLMNIPDDYYVLFVQGGASTQFSAVPLNLLNGSGKADFVNTGAWSKKAISEVKRYGTANVVASSEDKTFAYIPELDPKTFSRDADYFYIVTNNTIYGTVADMSSNILSEVIDVSKFGVIFAGAQKNIGPAGLTIVIVKKELVGKAREITPVMLNWKTHAILTRCTIHRHATPFILPGWYSNGCSKMAALPRCRASTKKKRPCCTITLINLICSAPQLRKRTARS